MHGSRSNLAASSLMFNFHMNVAELYPGTAKIQEQDGEFPIGSTWRRRFWEQRFSFGVRSAFGAIKKIIKATRNEESHAMGTQ